MMLVTVAAAAQAAAVQAAPAFHPSLDRPIAYTVSEQRDDGTAIQRFAVDRRVTFRKRDGGFVAEVETVRTSGGGGPAGRMFEGATRAMVGRLVTLLLDARGDVVDVVDLAAVWAAQIDGFAAALSGHGPASGPRAADVAMLMAPLRSLAPPEQIRRVGLMASPLVGGDLVAAGPRAPRSVSVPARDRAGVETMLTGTEQTIRDADGTLRFERSVANATSRASVLRRVDPATGMVLELVETTETTTGSGRMTIVRSTVITL